MTARRLIVKDAMGAIVDYTMAEPIGKQAKGSPVSYGRNLHCEIDLSNLPNANASMAFVAVLQEKCSLGHWHDTEKVGLPCWGLE